MIDYCQRLENKPSPPLTHPSGLTRLANSLTKCMETSMLTMEEKITAAVKEQAISISASIASARNEPSVNPARKTYAQATAKYTGSTAKSNPASLKPKQPPPPPLFPYIVLSQKNKDKHVEMNTDDTYLVERINQKLRFTADLYTTHEKPLSIHDIRGFSWNHRTGDLTIQVNSQDHANTATQTRAYWVALLSHSLRLKMPFYAIIVHGIPNSFNPESSRDVDNLKLVNLAVLDYLDSLKWPNRHSIELVKPFSSLLIHLCDPDEAKKAIKYLRIFFLVLKVVGQSIRKLGK